MTSWNVYGNRILQVFIVLFLALNPFPHVTAIQSIAFYGALLVAVLLIISRSADVSFRTPFTAALSVYLAWSLASIFWSGDRMASLHDFYTHLLTYVVLFFMMVFFFNTEKRFVTLVRTVVVSTALFSAAAIAYFYFLQGNPLSARLLPDRQVQPNMIGILTSFAAVLSFALLLQEKKAPARFVTAVCLAATLAAMVLTYSRGAVIALGFSLVLLFAGSWKRLVVAVFAGVCIISLMMVLSPGFRERLGPERIMQDGRIKIFFTALEIIKERPLTGIGFGMETFRKEWTTYNSRLPRELQSGAYFHTHNFILDVAVRLGLVGLGIFLFIAGIFFRTTWRLVRRGRDDRIRKLAHGSLCACVALLVAGLTGNIMNNHKSAVLFYICLALTSILYGLDTLKSDNSSAGPAVADDSIR